MERKVWVDWAKAIGIIMVVMGHSNYELVDIVSFIFTIHMPLFFFISGYLFNINKPFALILRNNIKGLLIPYLSYNVLFGVFAFLSCLFKELIHYEVDWNFSFFNGLWHTLFGVANGIFDGPTWFLLSLFWIKLLSYGFVRFNLRNKIVLLLFCICAYFVRFYFNYQFPFAFDTALVGIIWFQCGYFFKGRVWSIPNKVLYLLIVLSVFMAWQIYTYVGSGNYMMADVNGIYGLLGTSFGLLFVFSSCYILSRFKFAIITKISQASICIMCLHMLIQGPLNKITHYQNQLLVTFLGDLFIVLVLTYIYPILKARFPYITGNRK